MIKVNGLAEAYTEVINLVGDFYDYDEKTAEEREKECVFDDITAEFIKKFEAEDRCNWVHILPDGGTVMEMEHAIFIDTPGGYHETIFY